MFDFGDSSLTHFEDPYDAIRRKDKIIDKLRRAIHFLCPWITNSDLEQVIEIEGELASSKARREWIRRKLKLGSDLSNCILIGPDAGLHLTEETDLFILGCDGVEYLRADFSGNHSVLQVKDYGDPDANAYLAIKGWMDAQQRWLIEYNKKADDDV